MNREQLRAELKTVLEDDTGKAIPELSDDVNLQTGLGLDSLDVVSVVMQIEQQFRIRLTHDELATAATAGQLLSLIHGKLADATPTTIALSRPAVAPRAKAA
jgi:acyl carrier protein